MTDDLERIGGIGVDVTGTISGLEAALDRADALLREFNERHGTTEINITATTRAQQAGAQGAAQTTRSQQPAVAVDTSRLESKLDALIEALGRPGAAIGRARAQRTAAEEAEASIAALPPHMQPQARALYAQSGGRLPGETAPMQSFRPESEPAAPIAQVVRAESVSITSTQAPDLGIAALTTALQTLTESATALAGKFEAIAATPATAAPAAPQGGAGRSRRAREPEPTTYTALPAAPGEEAAAEAAGLESARRAGVRRERQGRAEDRALLSQIEEQLDRAGGGRRTPIDVHRDYAVSRLPRDREVEANRGEFAARQRMFLGEITTAERESRRAAGRRTTAAEQGLVDALYPSPVGDAGRRQSETEAPRRSPAEVEQSEREYRTRFAQGYVQPGYSPPPPIQDVPRRRGFIGAPTRTLPQTPEGQFGAEVSEAQLRRVLTAGAAREVVRAQLERAGEATRLTREADVLTQGRTARTGASGLAGFLFGGRRAESQAIGRLGIAERDVQSAIRYKGVFDSIILEHRVAASLGDENAAAQAEALKNTRLYKTAVEGVNQAEAKRVVAAKDVAKFSQGLLPAARNLLAITAGGAAFGVGLQAVGVAFSAAERAAAPYIDRLTGYTTMTAELTNALADQTRAQQGNAQGVTALKLAQAGFAQSTAATIQPVIAQRAQIEAGNKAIQEQIDTFRVAQNLRKQGATAGLGGGGTGGVLGTSLFGIPSTGEQFGNFLKGLNDQDKITPVVDDFLGRLSSPDSLFSLPDKINRRIFGLAPRPNLQIRPENGNVRAVVNAQEQRAGREFINAQMVQGGFGQGQLQQGLNDLDPRVQATANAFRGLSPEMEAAVRELHLFSTGITDTASAVQALRALNLAGTLVGPAEAMAAEQLRQRSARNSIDAMLSQIQYEAPAFLRMLDRQQNFALGTQIPAQQALGAIAAPATPVGTGISAASSAEQRKINAGLKEAQDLQGELNAQYEVGKQILTDTYQIPQDMITAITSTGQAIAKIQAGISNEQAAYQTAQYNYQLFIARRTLSDIGGLTGRNFGAGQSYLGVLERQNLQLSRQAQLLQFGLSQRQINLQRAVAGFTVPGLTPAEQNARVREAKIEADYAQKQLDIQRQMFRNQVKIVDISNLRQGRDLVKQIGLLQQGRAVQIDTQVAQAKLERLQKRQQRLVEEAGTYLTKVNAVAAQSISDIHRVEAASGQLITGIQEKAIRAAYKVGRALFIGMTGGFLSDSGSFRGGAMGGTRQPDPDRHASGAILTTSGKTSLGPYGVAGEAGDETVAILRAPRMLTGESGGSPVTINFTGDITVRTAADIEDIARKVSRVMGRDAQLRGLRAPN